MKDFIINNWQFIVDVGLTLIVFLVAVFKKGVKVQIRDDVISHCFGMIPDWINDAEKEFGSGHGPEKFNYVLRAALSFICVQEEINISMLPGQLILTIRSLIEDILSTPTKKEVSESEKR